MIQYNIKINKKKAAMTKNSNCPFSKAKITPMAKTSSS
jgi:hypothetical protein